MNWNKYPFVRMALALALGVLVGDRVGAGGMGRPVLLGSLGALMVLETVLHLRLKTFRNRWVFGVVTLLTLVWMGFVRVALVPRPRPPQEGWRLARVLEPPEEREKTVKVLLALEGVRKDSGWRETSGRVMAYFQKDEAALHLAYGDLLGLSLPLEEVAPPKNPMEFDYRKYLERRGVAWTVYLKSGDWMATGLRQARPLYAFAYRFRQRLLDALQACGITDDEFGVGAAILLGYDESLPAQVRKNYVAAGSMHILCVSGMHVGIIYLLASFLLGLLGKGKRMAFFRRVILLLLIWFYALITGLSPSILRSSLMISLMIVGELIHRKGFALNSIAASAFILLLFDPNHLFAMGFQLSYVAVLGIVLLQRPIYNRVYVKNRWLDKIWEITAVSLAAQIATAPFTVYYFNQFTPYFWLSNLLMTPLSFVVILLGMLLLSLSWVPWLNVALGKLVWLSLHLMNGAVAAIESLPMSLVKGLYMNGFQLALSLLMLLLLWLWVNLRRKRMMMELLATAAVFVFSLAWETYRLSHQRQVVVYSLRNHTAISVVEGFRQVLLCDEGLLGEPSAIDYSLKGYWAEHQLPMNPVCHTLDEDFADDLALKRNNLVSANGKLLALWNPTEAAGDGRHRLVVDYLLVRDRQPPDVGKIADSYQVGMLLIDGSVPESLAEAWIRQAGARHIPCRNLRDGAFVF